MKLWNMIRQWPAHFIRTGRMWWRHKHADEAAALAFYSLISLIPILLIGIYIASFIVDQKTATQIFLEETHRVAGSNVGTYFAQILKSDVYFTGSLASRIFGILFLFFSATKVIAKLRKSLGKVFGSPKNKGKKAALAGLIGRLAAVMMLFVLGVFIAGAVIFETLIGVIIDSIPQSSWVMILGASISPLLSFCATVLLAAVAMRWLPARPPRFREALIGGAVSAVLLLALKIGLAVFLLHSNIESFYGSALTLVVVLFWIYFAMQVFLFGAEFAAELAIQRRKAEAANEASNQ